MQRSARSLYRIGAISARAMRIMSRGTYRNTAITEKSDADPAAYLTISQSESCPSSLL